MSPLLCRLAIVVIACGLSLGSNGVYGCEIGQRTVDFTTEQLTISNVDVSPDGEKIVFDLLGDLYVVEIEGGDAVPLTRSLSWDARPVWSPDGNNIAFISDRAGSDQLFVIESSGKGAARQLSSGMDLLTSGKGERLIGAAEWMPDSTSVVANGARIAVLGSARDQLSLSGGIGNLYHGNGVRLYNFRIEPTDKSTQARGFSIWELDGVTGIWHDTKERLPTIPSGYEAPLLSRNGRWMVYKERSATADVGIPEIEEEKGKAQVDIVRVKDRRTGSTRVLLGPYLSPGWLDNSDVENAGLAANGRYAITPDSKFLVASYGGGLHRINIETGEISSIAVSVRVEKCLEPIARSHAIIGEGTEFEVKNLRSTTLRPDGKQIAFSALRRLYVADVSTGQTRPLASQSAGQFQPSYSPDGKWIAYASWNETEGGHLWRVRSTGGKPQRLTQHLGYYQTPVWSPDGKRIVFVGSLDLTEKRSGFHSEIHGGTLQILSIGDRRVHSFRVRARFGHAPSFSDDGQRIWYAPYDETRTTKLSLNSIELDVDRVREENAGGLLSSDTQEKAIPSPDGRLIALIRSGDLHLIKCARTIDEKMFSGEDCTESRITHEGAYDPRWRADGLELEWAFAEFHYRARTEDLLRWIEAGSHPTALPAIVTSTSIHLSTPRAIGNGVVVLVGAKIITMRGDEVIENGFVRVEDGVITKVGKLSGSHVFSDATVIDLKGKTLLPGFVDAHAHLTGLPRELLDANNGEALIYLAYGITTAKDPSNGGDHAYTYTELIKNGEMVGPRLFGTEALISRNHSITSLEDALGVARRTRRLGGTYLKYHTGFNRDQRSWIMEAARQTELGVAAHWAVTNYAPGRLNLSTVIDGAMTAEHALSDSQEKAADINEFLVRSGVSMNYSTIAGAGGYPQRFWSSISHFPQMRAFYVGKQPRDRDLPLPKEDKNGLPALTLSEERNAQMLADIDKRGGQVTIGSHGDYDGIGFHFEMWAHVRGGMTPHAVLRAATLHGAKAAGVEKELGSIDVGKIADMIVMEKNPLDDIRNTLSVDKVMQGGILRDAVTLDEIWPEHKPLPEWRMKDVVHKIDEAPGHTLH